MQPGPTRKASPRQEAPCATARMAHGQARHGLGRWQSPELPGTRGPERREPGRQRKQRGALQRKTAGSGRGRTTSPAEGRGAHARALGGNTGSLKQKQVPTWAFAMWGDARDYYGPEEAEPPL